MEQYMWHIIGIGSFSFVQALLIAGLVVQLVRRKRVEEALSEKELRLRESQAIAHVGSFHWDVVANTVAWSDELHRIYGFEPGEPSMTYETYLKQVHPDHLEQVRGAVERALINREPFGHEYRIVRPTGETRWVFAQGRPMVDAGGTLIALQGICQDITERKRAEAANLRRAALRADVNAALAEREGSLQSAIQQCAEAMVRHLDAAFARIWTLDHKERVLELQASAGLYTHLNGSHSRVPVGELKIGLIAKERQPHLTDDVCNDPRVNDREWARDQGMAAFAGYPLLVEDRVVGVMAMFARYPLTEDTLEALATV
ncbi:MAG: PAS domain-containing protein, partial [Blastocatellia bacterium]